MPILKERLAARSQEFIGKRVRVISGPAAGHVGVVTEAKVVRLSADSSLEKTGEFRIEFTPPIYLASAGWLEAVWRRPSDFTVDPTVGQGRAPAVATRIQREREPASEI
jgi:hypothetical protein